MQIILETRISFEEFVPIYQTVSKNRGQYSKEQFIEGLSHFDREGNGTIAVAEVINYSKWETCS